MSKARTSRIELHLMDAEYLLDSSIAHCERAHCQVCMGPLMSRRMKKALNAVRGARDLVRNGQGFKTPTLFAGSSTTQRGKGKKWSHHTPHKWAKDCELAEGVTIAEGL